MIERASLHDDGRPGWHPLSGAPEHILRSANRRRSAAGLAPVPSRAELLAIDDMLAAATAAATATAAGPAVWIDPGSRLARVPGRPAGARLLPAGGDHRIGTSATRSATTWRTTVLLVVGHGLARGHGSPGTIGKRIDRGAYGQADALNGEIGWTLKDGHDGFIVALAGPALRAVRSDVVPLLVQWTPDMTRPHHLELVRRIEAGASGVSAKYVVDDRRVMRLPDPTDVVMRARLTHVAILPAGDDPAFPGAFARVFRHRPDTADELRRQVAEVERNARWLADEAERAGR
jgi:hypothetical protein